MSIWMILRERPASPEKPSARSSVVIKSPLPLVGQARMRFASTAYRTIGNRWRQLAPAANLRRSTGDSKGERYAFRRRNVLYRLFDVGAGACPRARGARFRVGLGARALAYPAVAQD